jgi:heparan-alpha-glucosaminide N-acetyltransferase
MGFFTLSLFYVLIDVLDLWDGTPFTFPGANSIVVYFGSEILQPYFPFSFKLSDPPTHAEALASACIGVTCWVLLSYYMWWSAFFINV